MDRAFVAQALELAGVRADEKRIDAVHLQLQRIEELAAPLDAVALDPMADELAPVWRP